MKMWKDRSDSDAEFNFKLGLGDAFYHGLTLMNQKNSIIKNKEKAITKYKDDVFILKGQVADFHKKYNNEIKAMKDDANKAQMSLDQFQVEAKQAQELLEGENSRLQARVDELEASLKKREGAAYSMGFLDYLCNFLAADPEYDWPSHFAPSTPAFMSNFKEKNSAQIIEARTLLDPQIKSELKKLKAEKAARKDNEAPENQDPEGVSPSNQVAT